MPMLIAKKHTKIITIIASSVVILGLAIFGWLHFQQTTKAADMRQFNAGNIMSDAVMSNKNSMSVQQIQAFLTSKNPCNDTATYKAAWYPNLRYNIRNGKFVCISNETFNGESAAQIIWQTGQDYNINPQVLIVLLEKEQGLISDTWPNHQQYRTAVGFGCPDTAPCDAQYYGLKNQLRQAANLFRNVLNGGWSNYPVGQTYVQYNPNAACGGSVVNIQNRATSALYRYTPYQPNQSALNAGYGTGDGCGAYGNRNFWGLFTDWFGSTKIGIEVRGSIKVRYDSLGGQQIFGYPFYNERTDGEGTWWQCFENGCIIGNRLTGYWEPKGSIRLKWAELGYQDGPLGMPTSGEVYSSEYNSWEQNFENGKIFTLGNGTTKVSLKGSIYKAYDSYAKDLLPLPSDDERTDGKGTWWQKFGDGAAIIGNRLTGYWESKGSIRLKWAELGYQDGPLGMPIGHEIETSSGCYSQEYEYGRISGCYGEYIYKLEKK